VLCKSYTLLHEIQNIEHASESNCKSLNSSSRFLLPLSQTATHDDTWHCSHMVRADEVLSVGTIWLEKTHRPIPVCPIPVWQQLKFYAFLTMTLSSMDHVLDKVFNFVIDTAQLVAWEPRSYWIHWRVELEIGSFNSCPSLCIEVRPHEGDNYNDSDDHTEHWHNGRHPTRRHRS